MNNRYILYIDILGFTELVRQRSNLVDQIYEAIASLNVHNHSSFKTVVFSDTIVVYNIEGSDTPRDSKYLIMFMCEFVKDLMHRLTGRGVFFRSVITKGDFVHYEINKVPCFYGNALINAYNAEKELKAIGLFIDNALLEFCNIFKYEKYNDNYSFVYITQSLYEIEDYALDGFPIPSELIEHTDSKWYVFPEIMHICEMYEGSINDAFIDSIKIKYKKSWEMYCKHYPNITSQLLNSNLEPKSISPKVNWNEVIERYPEDYSYITEDKVEF